MEKSIIELPAGYKLNKQFSDEFSGDTLDSSKWYDFSPEWLGREPGFFDRKNVTVADGCLNLTACALKPEEVSVECKARGYDKFSTAYVRSVDRVCYGYFETRFKSMSAMVCNAFWLNSPLDPPAKYREGDFSEEIDIFEVFGKRVPESHEDEDEPHKLYLTTLHRFSTPYVEAKVNAKNTPIGTEHKQGFAFYDDFHVGSLLWTPDKLQWFLDGNMVWEQENKYYHRPMYLNVDCEIMKSWVGLPDENDLPSTYSLEYVRVWQLDNNA